MHSSSKPANLKVVLFDFEGTLVDGSEAIAASVNHVRGLHGKAALSKEEVNRKGGPDAKTFLENTVEDGTFEENLAAFQQHHRTVLHELTKIQLGAFEALKALTGRGLRLALCSNKPVSFTREEVEVLGFKPFFDEVLGPEDVRQPKPAPDMLIEALRRFGVQSSDALFVGDNLRDVQFGHGAGVAVWIVPSDPKDRPALEAAKPDMILDSLLQLRHLIGLDG